MAFKLHLLEASGAAAAMLRSPGVESAVSKV
ncbi:hypothetical protein CCACVL1_29265 [Corchorus capsularis]|uniref:Uncharacterized protein n=1 Tax=Corchorus capsularis TaxID=210143 RepID=A0A1R3G2L1_COCAP|nr:hypothetical protein CCACVL1_29265 [Corchorus capsularis]